MKISKIIFWFIISVVLISLSEYLLLEKSPGNSLLTALFYTILLYLMIGYYQIFGKKEA